MVGDIERGVAALIERHRVPGAGRLDEEEVAVAIDQIAVIIQVQGARLARLEPAVQLDPEQHRLLAPEHGRRLAPVPPRRVHLQLVEQLEGDPGAGGHRCRDLDPRRGCEGQVPAPGLRQCVVQPIRADRRRARALASGAVGRGSLPWEAADHLGLVRPKPAWRPLLQDDLLGLEWIEHEHQGTALIPSDVGVEQVVRLPIEERGHQVGVERLAVFISEILEALLYDVADFLRHLAVAERDLPLELGEGAVGEQQHQLGDPGVEGPGLLEAGQPVLLDARGRREGERPFALKHRAHRAAADR